MRVGKAVVTIDHDPSAGSERWRPPGEDAPAWAAPTLAVIGTALCLWLAPRLALLHEVAPVSAPIAGIVEAPTVVVPPARDGVVANDGSAQNLAPTAATSTAPSDPAASAPPSAARVETAIPVEAAPVAAAAPSAVGPASAAASASAEAGAAVASAPVPAIPAGAAAPAVPASVTVEASVAAPAAATVVPPPCLPVVVIPFAHDSTKPQLDGVEAAVRPLIAWLADHPGSVLSVEGHADTIGTEDYNIVLSFGRARAVVAWLTRFGVGADRTAPRAAGITPPKNLPVGMSTNRLVILQIEGVEVCRVTGGTAKSK